MKLKAIDKMDFKVETIVPREVLENVCITALEGGSNYWYYLTDDAVDLIRKAVPKSKEPYLSIAILKAVLDHDVDVPINDAEGEDEIVGYLSKKTMQERLTRLNNDANCRWALDNELNETGDASSSDVVFQYLAMGECVYG